MDDEAHELAKEYLIDHEIAERAVDLMNEVGLDENEAIEIVENE